MSDSFLVKTDPLSEACEFYRKVNKGKIVGFGFNHVSPNFPKSNFL